MNLRLALVSSLIGFGFLVGSIINFFHQSQGTKAGPSLLQGLLQGFGMLWVHLAIFIVAFGLLYATAGWLFAFLAQPAAEKLTKARQDRGRLIFLLFLLACFWVILENAARFPLSTVGSMLHDFAADGAGVWLRITLALVTCATLAFGAALRIGKLTTLIRDYPARSGAICAISLVALVTWLVLDRPPRVLFPADPDRPHIVIIGIDGWRPDTLPQYGADPGLMPFIESWIDESAYFEEAVTPMARSFPSWWTILTGQFPPTHGARLNLIDEELIRTQPQLPRSLEDRGYLRVFAIDERRFANIREDHGFDRIIGPGLGAADFLIGEFKDSPLSNLVVNTRLGRLLFPFNHANRAATITYRPETFDRLLARSLRKLPRNPLFLAVHYELPHWPFLWADGPTGKYEPHDMGNDYAHYLETLELVDEQVSKLFDELENLGVLQNAIVIVLSDHGEAFSNEQLTWENPETGHSFYTAPGHATHALGLTQNRIPLAFRTYGVIDAFPAGMRGGRASLADIYPTLAEMLEIEPRTAVDGQSLLDTLRTDGTTLPSIPIPIETGFNTASILDGEISQSRLFDEAAAYYRITRSGLLQIKTEYALEVIAGKQRAVLFGDQIMIPGIMPGNQRQLAWRVGNVRTRQYGDHVLPIGAETATGYLATGFCNVFAPDLSFLPGMFCATPEAASSYDD